MNIKDIAKIAGVGVSTVSRVLNDHPDVSKETRDRILKIMEDHHYIPNNSARNLKKHADKTIGIIVKGQENPLFGQMIRTIEEVLSQKEYAVLLHYHHHLLEDTDAAIQFVKEKRLRGLICLGGDYNQDKLNLLTGLNVPIVMTSVDLAQPTEGVCVVRIEDEKAAHEAVSMLIGKGHTKIGLIGTEDYDRSVARARMQGYARALNEEGLDLKDHRIAKAEFSFESGYMAANHLLTACPEITALFAVSDVMAIGAAKAILERGLRIPLDISIVGFDDLEYSKYFHPAITTVRQPVGQMAEKTAQIMMQAIEKESVAQAITMSSQLVIRASVCEVDKS